MARHLAPSPRLASFGYGASFGTGSSHHWTMGRRLWRGWACRLDFRAVRGVPSALCEAQQSELRAAVQELPAMAGIELANWKLKVIWDNAPAHRGEGVREYLRTPGLELRLLNLPGYSPDFNADEAVWGWAREEATGNLCLGSREAVQKRVGKFLAGLTSRKDEVRRRCRTVLQSRAESLLRDSRPESPHPANAHPTLALV